MLINRSVPSFNNPRNFTSIKTFPLSRAYVFFSCSLSPFVEIIFIWITVRDALRGVAVVGVWASSKESLSGKEGYPS